MRRERNGIDKGIKSETKWKNPGFDNLGMKIVKTEDDLICLP